MTWIVTPKNEFLCLETGALLHKTERRIAIIYADGSIPQHAIQYFETRDERDRRWKWLLDVLQPEVFHDLSK